MVIVYQSHTGFTKEYAQMLGKAEKMKTYTLAEAERQLLSDARCFIWDLSPPDTSAVWTGL